MSIANMDAMFVSAHAPSFDYRLVVGSVARDFGNPAYAPATDIAGNPRDSLPDAGCYEYNNQSPVLQSIGDKSVNEGTLLTFTLSASDPDGDAITYSAQNLPTGATLSGATFSWTPSYAQAGTYQVTFMASDGPAQDSETITIRVVNINRPPVLAPIGDKSVGEGAILNFTVSANDADGDPVTYSVQNLPGGASFASQRFSWTPAYNQAGTHQVTFTVSDGLAQDSETITIAVGNVNRAPVLDAIGDRSVFANELLTF
jgi:PKD repeat protein